MTSDTHSAGGFNWKHALGEAALIFIGIMLALGVHGWWRGHKEQRRVSESLSAIKGDLHKTVASLDSTVKLDSLSLFGARRMQGLLTSDSSPLPDPDTVAAWLRLHNPRFEPATAAIDQLIRAGDLDLIHDAKFRRELAAYSSSLQNARRQIDVAERLFYEQSTITRERSQAQAHWKGPWNTMMPTHTVTYDVKALRDDPVLRTAYMNTITHQATHVQIARRVRSQTQALLASLGEKPALKTPAGAKDAKPQQPAPKPGTRKPAAPRTGTPGVVT